MSYSSGTIKGISFHTKNDGLTYITSATASNNSTTSESDAKKML